MLTKGDVDTVSSQMLFDYEKEFLNSMEVSKELLEKFSWSTATSADGEIELVKEYNIPPDLFSLTFKVNKRTNTAYIAHMCYINSELNLVVECSDQLDEHSAFDQDVIFDTALQVLQTLEKKI